MPELPEVECVVRALNNCLPDRKITAVEFHFNRMLPQDMDEAAFVRRLYGRKIQEVKRRGKYILIYLMTNRYYNFITT